MNRATVLIVFALLAFVGLAALAAEREGTLASDFAQLRPPEPNKVRVAVLPFWGRDETQRQLGRSCVLLNLLRHGFLLVPRGCRNLSEVMRKTDRALSEDPKWDSLATVEPAEAARVGKAIGADWVIYGEIGELQVRSEKSGVVPKKEGVIDLRLTLVDAATGKTLYWSRVQDSGSFGGAIFGSGSSSIERRLLVRTTNSIMDDLASALPEHYLGAQVTPEEVQRTYESCANPSRGR
jgi:hypothetical protein